MRGGPHIQAPCLGSGSKLFVTICGFVQRGFTRSFSSDFAVRACNKTSDYSVNTTDKDVTTFNLFVTVQYDGHRDLMNMTEAFLPLMLTMATNTSEELRQRNGNGTVAAKTSRDKVVPLDGDVKSVVAVADMVVFADRSAETQNFRSLVPFFVFKSLVRSKYPAHFYLRQIYGAYDRYLREIELRCVRFHRHFPSMEWILFGDRTSIGRQLHGQSVKG